MVRFSLLLSPIDFLTKNDVDLQTSFRKAFFYSYFDEIRDLDLLVEWFRLLFIKIKLPVVDVAMPLWAR